MDNDTLTKVHASHRMKWVEDGTVATCITCITCSCHDKTGRLTRPCVGKSV